MLPGVHALKTVDKLRVKPRRDLDPHTCREEKQVQVSKVLLLVPGNCIAFDEASEDGVSLVSDDHVDGNYAGSGGDEAKTLKKIQRNSE